MSRLWLRLRPRRLAPESLVRCEHGWPVAECDQADEHALIREVDRFHPSPSQPSDQR